MASLEPMRFMLNGIFAVYKPRGWTSRKATDAVQVELSKLLWEKTNESQLSSAPYIKKKKMIKIGHGGTLDPLAEGVLVLGVGDGCKQLSTFLQCSKEYIVTAKFGEATDTYDAEGTVIQKCKTEHLNKQLIQDTLQKFKGHITQTPPLYSAVRLQGKRLYDYARLKLDLPEPIKTRQVFVEDIQLLDFHENSCKIRVVCGGGTYIRSIVHDMATQMETCAHVTALIRTRQGDFTIDDVYKLE